MCPHNEEDSGKVTLVSHWKVQPVKSQNSPARNVMSAPSTKTYQRLIGRFTCSMIGLFRRVINETCSRTRSLKADRTGSSLLCPLYSGMKNLHPSISVHTWSWGVGPCLQQILSKRWGTLNRSITGTERQTTNHAVIGCVSIQKLHSMKSAFVGHCSTPKTIPTHGVLLIWPTKPPKLRLYLRISQDSLCHHQF